MTHWKKTIALTVLAVFALAVLAGHSAAQSGDRFALAQAEQSVEKIKKQRERAEQELARRLERVQKEIALAQEDLQSKLARQEQLLALELQQLVKEQSLSGLEKELAAQEQQRAYWISDDPQVTVTTRTGQDVWVSLEDSGWLGVQITEVTAEKMKELKLPAERGALITEVDADSPAAKAGLKVNDVITEYNGQRVEGAAQLRRLVQETPAGRSVQLTVWRDGRAQAFTAVLGTRRSRISSTVRVEPRIRIPDFRFELPEIFVGRTTPRLGISGEDLSGELGKYFGAPDGEGVLVKEVTSGSPAERAGMKAGDVIIRIEGNRVRTLSDLREQLAAARQKEKEKISVAILRKGTEMALNVELEKPSTPERRRIASRTRV